MSGYYCAECKASASVVDGKVVRTCGHADSTVTAPRTSTLYGHGGLKMEGDDRLHRLLGMIQNLLLKIKSKSA